MKEPRAAGGRGWHLLLLLLAGCALFPGCRRQASSQDMETRATVQFEPHPPVAGASKLKITLAGKAGEPIRLGHLEVEGNMNHAGMTPVFTRLEETEPGEYSGTMEFTMGGDWFLLLSGKTADGTRFERKVDVPGVKPK